MKRLLTVMIIAMGLSACNDRPVDESGDQTQQETLNDGCGEGERVILPSETEVCIFRKPIVIETGFSCPAFVPNRFDFQTFSLCDPRAKLPAIDLDFLNYRDIVAWPESDWDFSEAPVELPQTDQLDLLWVIDNSGSMCQEQEQLRTSFDRFITRLAEKNVDFHIGITTTHMADDYPLEPVSSPGELQSQPQPIVGFDRSCWNALDAEGAVIPSDWTPVRDQIEVAVQCMTNPDSSFLNVTDQEIECALTGMGTGCEIARANCGGANPACEHEDLFPDPASYRSIPKVLRSADYQSAGTLDVDALRADFACASLVGTRGHGIEQGIAAAVRAVDPALTSSNGPNAGFIRPSARFGVFFVTDENDCSHDGTLETNTVCGGDVCEIANDPDYVDSPLLEVKTLRDELVRNLAATKGRWFDAREISVASFHGPADRFDQDLPADFCSTGEEPIGNPENNSTEDPMPAPTPQDYETVVMPVCATTNGISFSGDRYDRFMRSFPLGNTYPYAPNATVPIEGLTCQGMLAPSLEQAGEFLANSVNP